MGGSLSCHYCGESITEEDVLSGGRNFQCPSCGAGNDEM